MKDTYKHYKYKNLTIFIVSLLCAYFIAQNKDFHNFVLHLGNFGYLGAFVAGLLYVLSFTMSIGIVILFTLSDVLSIWELTLLAAIGSVLGDFLIFHFVKDSLLKELEPLYKRFGGNHLNHVLHSRYFHWTLPLIGGFLMAAPGPDELGVSLMGISQMKTSRFIFIAFLLDFLGIFLLISVAKAF